jgi:hypothetical protein
LYSTYLQEEAASIGGFLHLWRNNLSEQDNVLSKCHNTDCTNLVKPPREICKICVIAAASQEQKLAEDEALQEARATTASRKAAQRYKQKAQEKEAKQEEEAAERFDSSQPCRADEVRDILRERRNLTQGYVIEAAYRTGLIASKRLRIVANRFFWTRGVLSALKSLETGEAHQLLPQVEDCKAVNDTFRNQDRVALWDFATSWREQPAKECWWEEGHCITYSEYETLRALKGSPCKLGNVLLDRDFEGLHEEWERFFPQIPIDLLPENYTQKQFKQAMASISEIKDFLLMAFRGSFKTTWMTCFLLCFVCAMPSVRIMIASATTPLSRDTVKLFRKFFIPENEELTLFMQVFPEMCLYTKGDEGSVMAYECPAARLNLAQATMFSVGLDSTVSGRRFDLGLADDLSDNTNSDTSELRATTQRKWELMTELREGGNASFIFMLGTPYAQGDLLFTAIERNAVNTTKSLAVRIDPAFDILDENRARAIAEKPELLYQLEEHEVKMKFPSQFSWGAFRKSLTNSELKQVLQQKLLIFTTDGNLIKLNFEREVFDRNIVEAIPESDEITQIVLGLDRAHSTQRWADRSSLSILKTHKNSAGQPSACVLHVRADRWTTSELATQLVDCAQEYNPNVCVLEKDPAWRDLSSAILLECERRGITLNLFWKPVTQTPKAKVIRFKQQEALMNAQPSRLTFLRGDFIESVWEEYAWQDGQKVSSSAKQKDDRIDGISQALLVLPDPEAKGEHKITQDEQEKWEKRSRMAAQHERIFGSWNPNLPTNSGPSNAEDFAGGGYTNPIVRALAKDNRPRPTKTISFAIMNRPAVKR